MDEKVCFLYLVVDSMNYGVNVFVFICCNYSIWFMYKVFYSFFFFEELFYYGIDFFYFFRRVDFFLNGFSGIKGEMIW